MKIFLNDTSAEFVGRRLEVFRRALKIPFPELENKLGYKRPEWGRWANGKCVPDLRDMMPLCDHYEVTLDYIYRGDMTQLDDEIIQKIRAVVIMDPLLVTPHPMRDRRLRLIIRWETDADHRFRRRLVNGDIVRDNLGLGFQFPYSPFGRTRWELANAEPDDPVWEAHIATMRNRDPFTDLRYLVKSRSGRWVRIVTSGKPIFEKRRFAGYRGVGRVLNVDFQSQAVA